MDGLNVAQMKELRDKAEKHAFQAEVSRMMKLIINSLYRNKEVSRTEEVDFLALYGCILSKIPANIHRVHLKLNSSHISRSASHFCSDMLHNFSSWASYSKAG